ncbi:MAG: AMP-binding protein [Streptosporangiales bacterium]|nr:AMP-binding protein [Streptosporangiales bacterium]MBO0889320.1 AMP-binding protein [Acidothermales bacterium]
MSDPVTAAAGITVRDVFRRAFRIYADRVAVTEADGRRLTYAELGDRSGRFAAALYGLGIRKGDRVAVLSETRAEYVETYAALASLGATVLTLNIRLHPDELAYCVESGGPVALLCSGPLTGAVREFRDRAKTVEHWVCYDEPPEGFRGYTALLDAEHAPAPDVEIAASDVHNVLYTSGTTGRPKGAMVSHSAAATRGLRLAQWFGLTADDGFIGWLPLFHCGGDESLYATMHTGGTFGALRRADAETMFRMIERDLLSWTLLLPGVITDFLHHPRRTEYDLSSFRFAIGYANMMPHVVERLTSACDVDFYDAFGQTESSYLLAHGVVRPGTTPTLRKTPSPLLDVRLVDIHMNEVPVGQPGECVVRGPGVMSGYLDDPDATAEVFAGGWLHTGDVLVRHDDGTLSFVDRKKYLVKTGGENVYPAEVEQVIAEHDGVQEVCVFGVPDQRWGEVVKAAVVLRPGADLTAADVVAWCRERLAGYKRPRYVQFLAAEDLPRSTTGKLQRHELAKVPVRPEEAV